MKYKQRIIASLLLPLIILVSLLYYSSKSSEYHDIKSWININISAVFSRQNVDEMFEASHPVCQSEGLFKNVSSDFIANDIYEFINKNNYFDKPLPWKLHEQSHIKKLKYNELLTVIVVPHSHIDPGWIWTIDKYYNRKIRHILDNSVEFLTYHSDMTMIWVETIFLDMWWKENTKQKRMQLRKLIENGQFEIVSGGWVSVDEALTHYTAVLDQLIEGHYWLKEKFNIFPQTSWSLDPFGYSSSLPYLWKKSGMTGMNVVRILQAIKNFMASHKMLTFNWRQPWDLKGKYDISVHAEPNVLFCIAESCGPDPEICSRLDFAKKGDLPKTDNQPIPIQYKVTARNLEDFAGMIVKQYREKSLKYEHNVILAPHGCDFRYYQLSEFNQTYHNMNRLMKIINANKYKWNVEIKFGTVKDYFKLVNQRKSSLESPGKTIVGDFFPYSESGNVFWTGFFITRPFDKRMIRVLQELLRATEIITTFAIIRSIRSKQRFPETDDLKLLQAARRTHALMQHHDAITGTSTKETTEDYEKKMVKAMTNLQILYSKSQEQLFNINNVLDKSLFLHTFEYYQYDKPLRRRVIEITKIESKIVFSNAYSQTRKECVSLVIDSMNVLIKDPNNNTVNAQINPFWENKEAISDHFFEIYFEIEVPPMGMAVYTLKQATVANHIARVISNDKLVASSLVFKNSFLKATFSKSTGMLQEICLNSKMFKCTSVKINWIHYKGAWNDAYVFNTDGRINGIIPTDVRIVTGKLLSQVIVNHDYFRHVVTVYNGKTIQSRNVHIDNIAMLNSKFDVNMELMMQITTNIKNKDHRFYTDANGFQMIRRQTRFDMPTGGNFYPVTSMVILEDDKTRLAVHTAQPHGVASLKTGTLQLMIDRVPPNPGKGLPEPVLDQKPAHSKVILQLEYVKQDVLINNTNTYFIIHPSLSNILMNDELQHPVMATLMRDGVNPAFTRLQLIDSALPCNVIFANFRNFISADFKFIGTGLTFHKTPYSCNFKNHSSFCNKSKINLHNLFNKHAKISSVTKMSLSHFHEELTHPTATNIDVGLNELESYLVKWF